MRVICGKLLQFLGARVQLLRGLRSERGGVLLFGAAAALQGHRGLPAQGRQGRQEGDPQRGQ